MANGHTHTANLYRWLEDADAVWDYELIDKRFVLRVVCEMPDSPVLKAL